VSHLPSALPAAVVGLLVTTAPAPAKDLPALPTGDLPLAAQHAFGLTNIFQLESSVVRATIAPDAGRMVQLMADRPAGNLLRLDEALLGQAATAAPDADWNNYGGDWLWPVAQARWPLMQQGDWPPPVLFRNAGWSARAWQNADGSKYCLLSRDFDAPLHVTASRLIRVDPQSPRIEITQRIVRNAPSDIPVCLWHISQVGGASRVALPVESDSAFPGGYRVVGFTEPGTSMITRTDRAVVFDLAQGSEHKVGSDSPQAWIAAQKGDQVIVARATGGDQGGTFPDGGCRTTLYANKGLGYTEIETMSVERNLAPGESIENTVEIELLSLTAGASAEDLVSAIMKR
jgi:hypothetical protein